MIIKPYLFGYTANLVLSVCIEVSFLIVQAFVWRGLFEAANNFDKNQLIKSIYLFFSPMVLLCIVSPFLIYFYNRAVKKAVIKLKSQLFNKIFRVKLDYFKSNHSGELLNLVNSDVGKVEDIFLNQFRLLLFVFLSGAGSFISMLVIDYKIALILLLLSLGTTILLARFTRALLPISIVIQEKLGAIVSSYMNVISGIKIIKMFNLEQTLTLDFNTGNRDLKNARLKRGTIQSFFDSTIYIVSFINFGGIIVLGAFLLWNHYLDIATLTALVQLQLNVTFALMQIGGVISSISVGLASTKRLSDFLEQQEEKELPSSLCEIEDYHIEFQNVSFSYDHDDVLKNISFHIPMGKKVAFVGESGSGKSTIVKLLLNFMEPTRGKILIGGKDYRHHCNELRKITAYVPQDAYIFPGTVRENLKYGDQDASDEEIETISKTLGLDAFVDQFPRSDHAQLNGGNLLSGGQKQKITIARALLKNAKILILDEATSALDAVSEKVIEKAIEEHHKGTKIVIAHKLKNVVNSDIIFVMSKGEIIEAGDHHSLMNCDSQYKELYTQQQLSLTS